MSIGHILKAKREELDLTQDQLADETGISKPYISAIETGRAGNPPSEEKLEVLEKALKFAPGQLMRLARLERTPTAIREELERLRAENRKFRSALSGGDLDELYRSGKLKELAESADPSAGRKKKGSRASEDAWIPVINRVAAGYPTWTGDLDYPPGVADDYVRCPDVHDEQAFAARVTGDSMEPKYYEGDIVIFSPAAGVGDGDDCFVRRADTHETTFKRVFQEDGGKLRLQPRNERYAPQVLAREEINGIYKAVWRVEKLG